MGVCIWNDYRPKVRLLGRKKRSKCLEGDKG